MTEQIRKERLEKLKELTKNFDDFFYTYGDPYTTIVISMSGAKIVQEETNILFKIRD